MNNTSTTAPSKQPDTGNTTVTNAGVTATPTATPTVVPTVTPVPTATATPENGAPVTSTTLFLNKDEIVLGVKESVTLKVTKGTIASISSENTEIAVVTKDGKITAKKAGIVKINAYDSTGNVASVIVTVKKAPTKLQANVKKLVLKVGKKFKLKAKFLSGQYSNKITYKSSNQKIVKITNGKVVAKKKGKCKITLKTYNNKKCVVKVTVK